MLDAKSRFFLLAFRKSCYWCINRTLWIDPETSFIEALLFLYSWRGIFVSRELEHTKTLASRQKNVWETSSFYDSLPHKHGIHASLETWLDISRLSYPCAVLVL